MKGKFPARWSVPRPLRRGVLEESAGRQRAEEQGREYQGIGILTRMDRAGLVSALFEFGMNTR